MNEPTRHSFVFYSDWLEAFRELPAELVKELVIKIGDFALDDSDKIPEFENKTASLLFSIFKRKIITDKENWTAEVKRRNELKEKKSQERREAALKRWKKNEIQTDANECNCTNLDANKCKQIQLQNSDTNRCINDNDNDNVNINDNVNDYKYLSFKDASEKWKRFRELPFEQSQDKQDLARVGNIAPEDFEAVCDFFEITIARNSNSHDWKQYFGWNVREVVKKFYLQVKNNKTKNNETTQRNFDPFG